MSILKMHLVHGINPKILFEQIRICRLHHLKTKSQLVNASFLNTNTLFGIIAFLGYLSYTKTEYARELLFAIYG